jgi:nucleotide-binding universal stress UspA family protein
MSTHIELDPRGRTNVRVLIAVDGSPPSSPAVDEAGRETVAAGTEIDVLTVIVLGSHGHRARGPLLLGSTASAVAARAGCAVEISRAGRPTVSVGG